MKLSGLLAPLLTAALVACASAPHAGPPDAPTRQQDLISRQEIEASHYSNALDLVQALRPLWLAHRGSNGIRSPGEIAVYYDGVRLEGPRALSYISSAEISSLQYLPGLAATTRFGTNHGNGAILINSLSGETAGTATAASRRAVRRNRK